MGAKRPKSVVYILCFSWCFFVLLFTLIVKTAELIGFLCDRIFKNLPLTKFWKNTGADTGYKLGGGEEARSRNK